MKAKLSCLPCIVLLYHNRKNKNASYRKTARQAIQSIWGGEDKFLVHKMKCIFYTVAALYRPLCQPFVCDVTGQRSTPFTAQAFKRSVLNKTIIVAFSVTSFAASLVGSSTELGEQCL